MDMAQTNKPRLVVFDVEGVLIPKNRFLFDVGKALGVFTLIKLMLWGLLYEVGILKIESALRRLFGELAGTKIEALTGIFDKIPATPYLQSLCKQLKARNCKVAIISSGIPTVIVEKLASELCADYAYGVDVELEEDRLTGKISGDAITKNGKLKILQEILAREGMMPSDCIIIADDRNNSCIFLPEALKIGFNPDFILRVKANHVVNGKLSAIFPIIDGKKHKRSFPSVNDFVREDIHAAGFFVPVIAIYVGVPLVASLIIFIAILYVASELSRLEGRNLPVVSTITRHAASQSELYGFAAAPLYFATGIVATLLLFPHPASAAAIAAFCLGDSAASLFGGMLTTSLPFNKGKTLEGSLAGFVFAFLAALFFVPPIWALVAAAVAMTIEMLPLPINDNISVPIITGAVLTLLM
jgi:HAD superfamily phosphoserine phosphatase-like hydrolase